MTDLSSPTDTAIAAERALVNADTHLGLTAIDLITVIQVLRGMDGPISLITILEGALSQIMTAAGSLAAGRVGVAALTDERDQAFKAFDHLQGQIENIDQSNPLIAALVQTVYDAGLRDALTNRRGA